MELYKSIPGCRFSRWVVENNILGPSKFELVDIGAWGGIHPRWQVARPALKGVGFDLNADDVDRLNSDPSNSNLTYHYMGIGKEDGELDIWRGENPYNHSLRFPEGVDSSKGTYEKIKVRSLDSLQKEGLLGSPNFIKMDTEGCELNILAGAKQVLHNPDLLGFESETSFSRAPDFPRTHFFDLHDILVDSGFNMYDMWVGRLPRRTLRGGQLVVKNHLIVRENIGQACHFDVLFLRPRLGEQQPNERIIKMAMIFELYNLSDCALEHLEYYQDQLKNIISYQFARDLLTPPLESLALSYSDYDHICGVLEGGAQITTATEILPTTMNVIGGNPRQQQK